MYQFFTMNKRKVFAFLVLCIVHLNAGAQSSSRFQKQFEKAVRFLDAGDFTNSEKEALNILARDSAFSDAWLILADIYEKSGSPANEINALEKARLYSENRLILFRLAEVNYQIGNYTQALHFYEQYSDAKNISEKRKKEVVHKIENCRFALDAIQHPVRFEPVLLGENINSPENDYWPSISLDQKKLVFTRLIKAGTISQEDFYASDFVDGKWRKAEPLTEINSDMNEGAQTLSADGKLLFFTACNRPDGKGSCDIYYSQFENGKWTKAKNAGSALNTNAWEAQPGFSSDYRFLYFSSNRLGGKGAKDIWRAEFKGWDNYGNLKWGKVENLGDSVNSEGNEISPFIHPNNKNFYFVSDFLTGMGGYDLFTAEQKPDGTFSKAKNMGYPINTFQNELGLNISSDGKTAYFSSEREQNSGLDIYSFELDPDLQPEPVTFVKAKVINAKTKQPLEGHVTLVNLTNSEQQIRTESTDKGGELLLCLPLGANYAFNVSEEGYLFYSKAFQLSDTKTIHQPEIISIPLEPIEIGAEMNLYNIYFETDSFSILPESEPELQQLVVFLKNNASLLVEIQGHTDNSGNKEKNQILSEKRAKSVVDYLVKNGVELSRLKFKGYGDTKPVATNNTAEGRTLNRRTTIRISGK